MYICTAAITVTLTATLSLTVTVTVTITGNFDSVREEVRNGGPTRGQA